MNNLNGWPFEAKPEENGDATLDLLNEGMAILVFLRENYARTSVAKRHLADVMMATEYKGKEDLYHSAIAKLKLSGHINDDGIRISLSSINEG